MKLGGWEARRGGRGTGLQHEVALDFFKTILILLKIQARVNYNDLNNP